MKLSELKKVVEEAQAKYGDIEFSPYIHAKNDILFPTDWSLYVEEYSDENILEIDINLEGFSIN